MVAPIIPKLSQIFSVTPVKIGWIIPAFLIPYGASTLFYGPLSDRYGRKPVLYLCLAGFAVMTGLTSLSDNFTTLWILRLLSGLFAGGIVPITLALISDLFAYNERGRAIGWLFGAMAGGMAFGSTFGAVLEPIISWRFLFLSVSILIIFVFVYLTRYRDLLSLKVSGRKDIPMLRETFIHYRRLLQTGRGIKTYLYVFLNGLIHSGVYTWLGYWFSVKYGLGEVAIGIALLGYGIPGFVFGPAIGRVADRIGRNILIPVGLTITACSSVLIGLQFPILIATLIVAILSLGYDMTQPLLAGIVTDLSPQKGSAIGMMAFALFLGFGTGSVVFSIVMELTNLTLAFICFGLFSLLLSLAAFPLFRTEGKPL